MSNIDSLDRSILGVLRDNGRAAYVEIAKSVGVTLFTDLSVVFADKRTAISKV